MPQYTYAPLESSNPSQFGVVKTDHIYLNDDPTISLQKALKVYPILDEETEILNKYGLSVVNINYPYCNIDRYGADNTGVNCVSNYIQACVDLVEKLYISKSEVFPIEFGPGTYLMTHSVLLKHDKDNTSSECPLYFKGYISSRMHSAKEECTQILLAIKNHKSSTETDLGYSNAFAVNCSYSDIDHETNNIVFLEGKDSGTGSYIRPIMNNISFKYFTIVCNYNNTDYNVNFIKGYRFRCDIDHVVAGGVRNVVCQPQSDASGNNSYCDFSSYTNINLNYIKNIALELYNPDLCKIENITSHNARPTLQYLIRIIGGGSIYINRVHYAYQFKDDTSDGYIPRNDGTSEKGNTALILVANNKSCMIQNIYVERGLKDYIIRLYNARNVSIDNCYEAFMGNGFLKLSQTCINIKVSNIYRNINLVKEYPDIRLMDVTTLKNIKIENFTRKRWFKEDLSLSTTDEEFKALTRLLSEEERIIETPIIQYRPIHNRDIDFGLKNVKVYYDSVEETWKVKDIYGNDVTSEFMLSYDNKLYFRYKNGSSRIIHSIYQDHIWGDDDYPYNPIVNTLNGEESIVFFDAVNGTRATELSNKMHFSAIINVPDLPVTNNRVCYVYYGTASTGTDITESYIRNIEPYIMESNYTFEFTDQTIDNKIVFFVYPTSYGDNITVTQDDTTDITSSFFVTSILLDNDPHYLVRTTNKETFTSAKLTFTINQ